MTSQTTSTILDNAIANSQELLTKYALGDEPLNDFTTAFGYKHDRYAASDLIIQWQTGDFGSFPEVEIRSSAEINGANGAYSADTNKIYISEEYLLANTNDIKAITDLVLEEYGHFVDATINTVDSAGDEGAIFSGLVQGEFFTERELQQLQLENDQAVITLDGEEIAIEQQISSVVETDYIDLADRVVGNFTQQDQTPLSKDFALRLDNTNVHIGDFNGDGKDDFLRQEKGNLDNDNKETARIFFSNSSGSPNGTFHPNNRLTLPEDLGIKGDETNLYIGDFDGDGKDDILRQKDTARIYFSRGGYNSTFALGSRFTLPGHLSLQGDKTNLYIGDFDGDGKDDILRQEKGSFDNDDINTAQILFSNNDPKKRFNSDKRVTLPESFNIKGDLTDLHVGDFNGDGKDDFLRVRKGNADISSKIFFSNGDGTFSSVNLQVADNKDIKDPRSSSFRFRSLKVADMNGDGKDDIITHSGERTSGVVSKTSIFLSEDDGNFSKPAGIGFSGHIDQTASNIQTGDFNGDGNHDLIHLSSRSESNKIALVEGFTLVGSDGDDILVGSLGNDRVITGRGGNDKLTGREGNDVLDGGEGNDVLDGGEGSDVLNGREGNDTVSYENSRSRVIINLANSTASGGDAEGDAIFNFENVIGSDFNDILTGDDSDNQLIGNKGTDVLNGGAGDDILNGGSGNDTLNGGDNNDILEGGAGNDLLDGGGGLDIASYQGNLDGFDITVNDDGSITVKDIDTSDGDEGTDTLTNISQLAFGGNTQLRAGSNTNTVLGIAGVHESTDNTDTSTSIAGGKAAATNFVIDIEGESGLGLDFDTTKLANFINDITLPDQDIENARLAANLGFDLAAGGAGLLSAFPVIGDVATAGISTGIAMAQTLSNYAFDLAQVQAQRQAATDAVNNTDYDPDVWLDITETNRDIVVIEDFQIGVDNLFLPSLANVNNVGYATKTGTFDGKEGVFIEAKIRSETSDLVFIVNNYEGEKDKFEFGREITKLIRDTGTTNRIGNEDVTEFSGIGIGTFNHNSINVEGDISGTKVQEGTFAGDHIIGLKFDDEIEGDGKSGTFELRGEFGDDLIQGGEFDDTLNGGFNTTPTFANITYEDDGFDILQGGKGDDLLNGGSGNDTLDGGGFNYDDNLNVTGVIVGDGTDTLIGGSGNDTFVFNTSETGIDVIKDFTVLVDKIQINQEEFGATGISDFSFDATNGALSFGGEQFAILENNSDAQNLQDFDVNRDIQLV